MTDKKRCEYAVYVRDTYRRDGRSKSGMSLHYERRQCKRLASSGKYCAQHAKIFRASGAE